MPTVRDIRDEVINFLLRERPKFSDFVKSNDRRENEKFFDKIYACNLLIKKFSDDLVQDYDLDFFLYDLEGSIEVYKMFCNQERNMCRYLTLEDVYKQTRQII